MDIGADISREAAASALGWLVAAGIDTLVEEAPRDWLGARTVAVERSVAEPAAVARTPTAAPAPRALAALSADSLSALAAIAVELWPAPLLGTGEAAAGVLLMGDAPTADDVAAGHVFAGPAGLLLDRMLASIGRDRTTAYLTNATYWHGSGAPDAAAAAALRERQLTLARPRAILALGGVATAALCGVTQGINRLRGRWQVVQAGGVEVPVLPTFHPAYLLAHPQHKALAWADLLAFRKVVDA